MERIIKSFKKIKNLYYKDFPKVVFWAIINFCNGKCKICRFCNVPEKKRRYVNSEDAKKAIDILYNNGVRSIGITGGEPLLNPDIFKICEYIYKKKILIGYIVTNGILVTRKIAKEFKKVDVNLVGISIDIEDKNGMGVDRKIPNIREICIRARKYLEKEGMNTYAGVLITKNIVKFGIPKLIEYVKEMGFDKIIFSYPQIEQFSSYKASRKIKNLQLSQSEIIKIIKDIKCIKKTSVISIVNTNAVLDEFQRFYLNIPRKYKCYGGKWLFYLDWDLKLYQCYTLKKCYGNLLELKEIKSDDTACDFCMQQGFRDYGPYYELASTLLKAKRKLMKEGNFLKTFRIIINKKTFTNLKTLYESISDGVI